MYLDQVNYELNKKINDFVCNSNDATTPEESIDILNQAWELLPKPATQFVEPTSAIACGVSENYKKFEKWLSMLLRMGKRHITVLRYLDITIMTEGLHRAGQDDVDAHARRFDNRIIRNSTRLATFDDGEMSDYYKDKVLTDGQACKILGFELPNEIDHNGKTYVKSTNGYVLKEYENNKDVKRGLYMLGIPSNFISKINLCEWGHVFKERCDGGGANPEVKEWAEQVMKQITEFHKEITRDYVLSIQN